MREKLAAFVTSPSPDTYHAIRDEVIASDHYDPYSSELDQLDGPLAAQEYSQVRESISAAMPNLLLSPRAHWILSFVAMKTNDLDDAAFERALALLCTEGILGTGDGGRGKPYVVVRVSDEYDVMRHLGKKKVEQSLVLDGDRHLDVVRCEDGSELWFEITDPYQRLLKDRTAAGR